MTAPSRWVILLALGLLLLNWPVLGIFHERAYLYLLLAWACFILLLAAATRGTKPPPRGR